MRLLLGFLVASLLVAASCGGETFTSATGGSTDGGAGSTGVGGSPTGGAGGASAGSAGSSAGGAGGSSAGAAGSSAGSGGSNAGGAGAQAGSAGSSGASGSGGSAGTCTTPAAPKPEPTDAEQVLAVTDDLHPEYPVLDDTHVYWTTDTTLWRVDKAGTCLQQVATGGTQLEAVVLDTGFAYVADSGAGTAYRVPLTGGTFETIVSNQTPVQIIAVDATHIYWCRVGSGVARKLKDGTGNMEVIATACPMGNCFAIAIDDTYVFAATRNGLLARAQKIAQSPVTQIDSAVGTVSTNDPVHIGLYANRVYWTHWLNLPDSGAVRSVNKDGQNPVSTVETHPEGLAVDSSSAYWAVPFSPGGSIRKGNAALTTVSELVSNQLRPRGVAIDTTHVYWTNYNDQSVRRALR